MPGMSPIDEEVDYEMEYELKHHEYELLKQNYDEYVESSKELERELEVALRQSDSKVTELEKKLSTSETKYKSLQDNYDRLSREFSTTISSLQSLQSKVSYLEEKKRELENDNEELSSRVRVLEATEEDLMHQLNEAKEDIVFLKNDLENIQDAKMQEENVLKNEIMSLKDDVQRGLARRRRSSIKAADFGMDPLEFNEQENELQKKEQENLELTVRELAVTINELESENSDLQGQIYHLKKRLSNGVVDRRGSVDSLDEMNVLRDEIEALNEVIQQKDNELEEMNHLKEQLEEKDERLRLIEKEFMEMLTPTFKAAKADTFYRMVPSSIKQHSTHLQIDSTTSVMGRLKSFLGSDDSEKLKKELIKMVGKYEAERNRSVQLLNKIQSLQGNIIACCRTRPPSDQELAAGGKIILDTMDDSELMFYDSKIDTWKSFAFDRVWKADKNQVDVFADVEPVIISVADGYNACIMAYGQTGSGKTYTMDGYNDQYGISYRTIQKLFEVLETKKSNKNGSNKNLLALTAKSPRETPKATREKFFPPQSGPHSNSKSKSQDSTFEFVNPMNRGSSRNSQGSLGSRTTSFHSDRGTSERNSLPSFSPPNIPGESEPLELGIAAVNYDGIMLDDEENFIDNKVDVISDASDDFLRDEGSFNYHMEVSMLEIYNEQVYDLLHDQFGGGQTDGVSLDLRLTPENMVVVPGLKQCKVRDMDEVETVFSKGAKNRATSATNLNENSSRSHLITIVEVTVEEADGTVVKGKLFLVDLAGSERIAKSGAKGTVLKEAQYINKSLSALGDVMEALDQKQKHIPFRNSKLTYLLQNALGGNAKTIMIFTVCPTDLTSDESLFTLQFAQRVRNITLTTAHRNISAKNLEISVKMLKSELRDVKKKKIALEELLAETKKDAKKALEKSSAPLESKIKQLEEAKRSQEFTIQNLQKQIHDLSSKIDDEKNSKQQSLFDLELTQRNLKRALEISKEYTAENDRISGILKTKEKELELLKEAVAKTILAKSPSHQATPTHQNKTPTSANKAVVQQQQPSPVIHQQQLQQHQRSPQHHSNGHISSPNHQPSVNASPVPPSHHPTPASSKRRNSDGDIRVSFSTPVSSSTSSLEQKLNAIEQNKNLSPVSNHKQSSEQSQSRSHNSPVAFERTSSPLVVASQEKRFSPPQHVEDSKSNYVEEEKSMIEEHSSHDISIHPMHPSPDASRHHPQHHTSPSYQQSSHHSVQPQRTSPSLSASFSRRLSPAGPSPGQRVLSPGLLQSSVTSIDSVLGPFDLEEHLLTDSSARKDGSLSVRPNVNHKKIVYERKPPVPRQQRSTSASSRDSANSTYSAPTSTLTGGGGLKRVDSHGSLGGSSHYSGTISHSTAATARLSARSQDAMKKHQQRMEQRNATTVQKGRIY